MNISNTKSRLLIALALLVVPAMTQTASAQQNKTQAVGIGIGPIRIVIGDPWRPGPGPRPGPRPLPTPQPQVEYVVQEYNPVTGGLHSTRRFRDQSQAYAYRDSLARAHWVKWRFFGINEPLRYQRFSSGGTAQHFIRTDGPSKTGKLGFAVLTKETRAVPTRVVLSTRTLR